MLWKDASDHRWKLCLYDLIRETKARRKGNNYGFLLILFLFHFLFSVNVVSSSNFLFVSCAKWLSFFVLLFFISFLVLIYLFISTTILWACNLAGIWTNETLKNTRLKKKENQFLMALFVNIVHTSVSY